MKTHTTFFTVYPDDCNYMVHDDGSPMVHGGTMLLKMDRAAAELARLYLNDTECDSALTVGVDGVQFLFGAKLGDLIKILVKPSFFGIKRMTFLVECYVIERSGNEKLMCTGNFSFCSFKKGISYPHGKKLD